MTVTDPTSAPAAPPNPEVQPVVDAHIANMGYEHFPGGYFPIPYTLTSLDAESFPQLPPLRQPLEAALFGKWDQPGNPHLVWRIDATPVNFALTRGVLSRFCCAVMGRYPTTLAVELKLSQVTLEAFNKTLKLCTATASKEFRQRSRPAGEGASGSRPRGAVAVGGSSEKKVAGRTARPLTPSCGTRR